MTTIQIITFGDINPSKYGDIDAEVSNFTEFSALDDFDINILDFSSKSFWKVWLEWYSPSYQSSSYRYDHNIMQKTNLKQICDVVRNCKTTIILVAPLNLKIDFKNETYKLNALVEVIGNFFGGFIQAGSSIRLTAEKTTTKIGKMHYNAFLHLPNNTPKNKSEKSEKSTTVKIYGEKYITALNIFETVEHFQTFILEFVETKETKPSWFHELQYFDDEMQREIVFKNEEIIRSSNQTIKDASDKLENNNRFKSILYTNGDELMEVVHEIMEELLDGDLSSFVDEHIEDFRISKDDVTFFGEIKGTTSNVSNSNISQLTNHCDIYEENCKKKGKNENIRRLLIINHQRDKTPAKREPVHHAQIEKAKRDGCLIIETPVLLKLYELVTSEEYSSKKCIELLKEKTGLLSYNETENIFE